MHTQGLYLASPLLWRFGVGQCVCHMQVNNACATGSTALVLARQLVEGGDIDHFTY